MIGDRSKLEKELTEAMAQNLKLNDKIKELERRCSESTANMYDAKEKVKETQIFYRKIYDFIASWP